MKEVIGLVMGLLLFPTLLNASEDDLRRLRKELSVENHPVKALELKMSLALALHSQGEHQEDVKLASSIIEEALALRDTLLYAKSLNHLGLLYRYHQLYAESAPLHQKAFDLVEKKDVPLLDKMIFANNTGVSSRYNSDYNTAMVYYLKSLKIAEQENNLKNIAISCNGLGNTLIYIPDRQDEALVYLQRALEISKALENKLGIAMNYLTISHYYSGKKDFTTSRRYLEELLSLNIELQDKFGIAVTYQALGESYLEENQDLKTANQNFTKALALFQELGDRVKQGSIHYNLGLISLKEGKYRDALEKTKTSLQITKELNNKELIFKNSEQIAIIYEALNNPKQALAHYKVAQEYKDSINLSNQATEIAIINSRYNIEKKESEINLLIKDRSLRESAFQISENKLRTRTITLFFMAFSILFMLLLFFIQKRNRRRLLETDKKLQQQEKERLQAIYEKNLLEAEMLATRMQVNPHFLFNSLNSIKYLIQCEQNKKAIKYLITFSRFTRMVLETSQKPLSALSEELDLTHYYLKLESNRFNEGFSFSIENFADERYKDLLIPTLLLQPFVENAIWHGLLPKAEGEKNVCICITDAPHGICITIEDNGVGRKANPCNTQHQSMGHKITHERIQLYNKISPNTIEWNIIDKKDGAGNRSGTCIRLLIKLGNNLAGNTDKEGSSPGLKGVSWNRFSLGDPG